MRPPRQTAAQAHAALGQRGKMGAAYGVLGHSEETREKLEVPEKVEANHHQDDVDIQLLLITTPTLGT